MSKFNLLLIWFMVIFVVFNVIPQLMQAVLFGIGTVYVILSWLKNKEINKYALYFFILALGSLLLTVVNSYSSISIYYLLSTKSG